MSKTLEEAAVKCEGQEMHGPRTCSICRRAYILDALIPDLVVNLLYYDRKEDENLRRGEIEKAVKAGELSWDDIADRFRKELSRD